MLCPVYGHELTPLSCPPPRGSVFVRLRGQLYFRLTSDRLTHFLDIESLAVKNKNSYIVRGSCPYLIFSLFPKDSRMDNTFRFLMYHSAERNISVNAVLHDETIWLTQKAMAGLFDCTPDNISLHLKNIFADGELDENSTTEDFSAVAKNTTVINCRMSLASSLHF
mgnify:CR=1 FL=1